MPCKICNRPITTIDGLLDDLCTHCLNNPRRLKLYDVVKNTHSQNESLLKICIECGSSYTTFDRNSFLCGICESKY